jgi:hypothetical protein
MTSMQSIRIRAIEQEELPLTDLQRALLRAGVKILDADDVEAYQRAKLLEARDRLVEPRPSWLRPIVGGVLVAVGVFVSCMFVASLLGRAPAVLYLVVYCAFFAGAFFGLARAVRARLTHDLITAYRLNILMWRRYRLGWADSGHLVAFSNAIHPPGVPTETVLPPEGVAICKRIAKAGAACMLAVDQLDEDPFLSAAYGSERYFLFAWDEQGFVPQAPTQGLGSGDAPR